MRQKPGIHHLRSRLPWTLYFVLVLSKKEFQSSCRRRIWLTADVGEVPAHWGEKRFDCTRRGSSRCWRRRFTFPLQASSSRFNGEPRSLSYGNGSPRKRISPAPGRVRLLAPGAPPRPRAWGSCLRVCGWAPKNNLEDFWNYWFNLFSEVPIPRNRKWTLWEVPINLCSWIEDETVGKIKLKQKNRVF